MGPTPVWVLCAFTIILQALSGSTVKKSMGTSNERNLEPSFTPGEKNGLK